MNSSEKRIADLRQQAIRSGDKQMEVACDLHQSRLDALKEGKVWIDRKSVV